MSPVLETRRLILRLPQRHEAADIMVEANNPRISSMLARMPYPYRLSDAEFFVRMCEEATKTRHMAHFGIYLKRHGGADYIGGCGFSPLDKDPVPHLGYWISERHWGKGYANEAARAVQAFAFDERGLPELHSGCRPDNAGSRAVLEKLGFRHVGSSTIYAAARRRVEAIDSFVMTSADWRRMKP
jgi:RimJ/RimL family protein N-acetyltransferase